MLIEDRQLLNYFNAPQNSIYYDLLSDELVVLSNDVVPKLTHFPLNISFSAIEFNHYLAQLKASNIFHKEAFEDAKEKCFIISNNIIVYHFCVRTYFVDDMSIIDNVIEILNK